MTYEESFENNAIGRNREENSKGLFLQILNLDL